MFIGAAAVAGIYVGTQPTVIDGDVMAAELLAQHRSKGWVRLTCDPKIPVSPSGATFQCQSYSGDGASSLIRFTLDRSGGTAGTVVEATRPRPAPGTDSWSN